MLKVFFLLRLKLVKRCIKAPSRETSKWKMLIPRTFVRALSLSTSSVSISLSAFRHPPKRSLHQQHKYSSPSRLKALIPYFHWTFSLRSTQLWCVSSLGKYPNCFSLALCRCVRQKTLMFVPMYVFHRENEIVFFYSLLIARFGWKERSIHILCCWISTAAKMKREEWEKCWIYFRVITRCVVHEAVRRKLSSLLWGERETKYFLLPFGTQHFLVRMWPSQVAFLLFSQRTNTST